jgi:hypothetical protein
MRGEEQRAQMAAVLSRQELMSDCAFTDDVVQATSMEFLRTTADDVIHAGFLSIH